MDHRPVEGAWRARLGASALAIVLAASGGGGGCQCAPPEVVSQTMAGVDVRLDSIAGRIELSRGGRSLLDVPAFAVGARDGDAVYEMQFGMFNIQQDEGAFTFAAGFVVAPVGADTLTAERVPFAAVDAEGAPLVRGALEVRGAVLALTLTAAREGDDRLRFAGPCPLAHAIGLGAQTHDVDHVGQRVPLWVSEQGVGKTDDDELPAVWQLTGRRHSTHVPMPVFVTDRAAAYVLRTSAFAEIDLCSGPDGLGFEVWDTTASLELHAADTPLAAQQQVVDALGRPAPLPPWGLGPWHDAIFGEAEVRATAQRLRDEQIPSTALWTEDWRGGEAVGAEVYRLDEDWRLDRELYPTFEDMVAANEALGFKQLVYFNTFVTQGGDVFEDITQGGFAIEDGAGGPLLFTGVDADFSPTALADLTDDGARAYVREHLEGALALGARGWMADFAEWMPVDGAALASGEDPALVHNRYPVLWAELNRAAIDASGLADDVVVFHRSGHLGSQPVTQVMWAGDQRTDFQPDDGLPTVLPIAIGLSTVGFGVVTHDIGGYQSSTNDPVDQELFFRWTSLGALSPIMRTHHGTHALVNVNAFTNAETLAHYKRWCEAHVLLYPYLRALSLAAVEPGGLPMWIPLPLLFPADEAVWPLKDEVMLGPSLLVAPVVDRGATARRVTFPSARFARFAPFFPAADGDDVVELLGPATLDVDVPLADIAVYVVAGGVVPMLEAPVDTLVGGAAAGVRDLDDTEGDRTVVVGAGASGTFVEESGARYDLACEGGAPSSSPAVVDDGDGVAESDGGGCALTLTGHPAARTTTVHFL